MTCAERYGAWLFIAIQSHPERSIRLKHPESCMVASWTAESLFPAAETFILND
jgi:hypothetical protein